MGFRGEFRQWGICCGSEIELTGHLDPAGPPIPADFRGLSDAVDWSELKIEPHPTERTSCPTDTATLAQGWGPIFRKNRTNLPFFERKR